MSIWLPEFKQIRCEKKGFNYTTQGPYRLVIHTTEIGELGTIPLTHINPPQLWADLNKNIYLQGISLDKAGYSLKHPSDTIDTNGLFCVQVTIIGFANDIQHYSDEWYKKLALNVVKPICDAVGIDYQVYKEFKGEGDVLLASTTSVNRMSTDEWANFNGVCGHQHVPNNAHLDPGKLEYQKVIDLIKSSQLIEA